MQTIKDLGIDSETMVIFTSDNGPALKRKLVPTRVESWAASKATEVKEKDGV